MAQGPQGEERLLAMIREATGVETVATSQLVREAFQVLGLRTLVLLTPYRSNHTIIAYPAGHGLHRGPRRGARAAGHGLQQRHATAMGRARAGPCQV